MLEEKKIDYDDWDKVLKIYLPRCYVDIYDFPITEPSTHGLIQKKG